MFISQLEKRVIFYLFQETHKSLFFFFSTCTFCKAAFVHNHTNICFTMFLSCLCLKQVWKVEELVQVAIKQLAMVIQLCAAPDNCWTHSLSPQLMLLSILRRPFVQRTRALGQRNRWMNEIYFLVSTFFSSQATPIVMIINGYKFVTWGNSLSNCTKPVMKMMFS